MATGTLSSKYQFTGWELQARTLPGWAATGCVPISAGASGDQGMLQEMVGGIPKARTLPGPLRKTLLEPCPSPASHPWGQDGAPLPPWASPGTRRVGGSLAPTNHPETWLGLAERPKLLEPKIAPDARRRGGSAGMCQD